MSSHTIDITEFADQIVDIVDSSRWNHNNKYLYKKSPQEERSLKKQMQ
jgi:hypothetical protein